MTDPLPTRRIPRPWWTLALLVATLPGPARAQDGPPAPQDAPSAIFAALAGAWEGEGTLLGRAAAFTMTWEDRDVFAVLTFASGFLADTGDVTPVLAAGALYRTAPAAGDAAWLDSRGERIEIRWTATDATLVADWSSPSESGRTTYRLTAPGRVEVTDEVRTPDGLRTFGTAVYRRAADAG